ncbi:MAG: beta-ketoacyl-[acyl-carrier-protein] synthase II, partial [Oscillospiraceae bacterium]|nr:beta-ketoacyl-[acyl-carrier-protein] synthase II [Oscillospiraceae bacterium]
MKKVVITGMGAVTPIGNNISEFQKALFEGKNGIGFITKFDITDSKYKVAGEIKNLDTASILGKPFVRRTDVFT